MIDRNCWKPIPQCLTHVRGIGCETTSARQRVSNERNMDHDFSLSNPNCPHAPSTCLNIQTAPFRSLIRQRTHDADTYCPLGTWGHHSVRANIASSAQRFRMLCRTRGPEHREQTHALYADESVTPLLREVDRSVWWRRWCNCRRRHKGVSTSAREPSRRRCRRRWEHNRSVVRH